MVKRGEIILLPDLRNRLAAHPAFQPRTKLDILADNYGVKIIWCPKYHCECNPIEGYWGNQKTFIRKYTDQTYKGLVRLIPESRQHYIDINLNIKLIRRFWRTIQAYKSGESYIQVLKAYFSGKSKEKIIAHRKITTDLEKL